MNKNGEQLIDIICDRIRFKEGLCYDSTIVQILRGMTNVELNEAITFGNVSSWVNEKRNKEADNGSIM